MQIEDNLYMKYNTCNLLLQSNVCFLKNGDVFIDGEGILDERRKTFIPMEEYKNGCFHVEKRPAMSDVGGKRRKI